ncbi:hypothetical protein AB8Q28_25365 [Klebsiella variicola]|nr:hypothetical protein [Klebsiella variicola]
MTWVTVCGFANACLFLAEVVYQQAGGESVEAGILTERNNT